jgi:hypothetical protein
MRGSQGDLDSTFLPPGCTVCMDPVQVLLDFPVSLLKQVR